MFCCTRRPWSRDARWRTAGASGPPCQPDAQTGRRRLNPSTTDSTSDFVISKPFLLTLSRNCFCGHSRCPGERTDRDYHGPNCPRISVLVLPFLNFSHSLAFFLPADESVLESGFFIGFLQQLVPRQFFPPEAHCRFFFGVISICISSVPTPEPTPTPEKTWFLLLFCAYRFSAHHIVCPSLWHP